jgi:putative intracellular protease/amidase
MGRHTRKVEKSLPEEDGPRGYRRVGKVPLLPAVTGVVAIGAIVSAVSTQQISLNFAGGPPSQPHVTASPDSRHSRARDDSSLSPRGNPVSRGAGRKAFTVAFRTLSTSDAGYQGQVTITNRSATTVRGWTLVLRYPGTKILSAWDVRVVRKGTTLVAQNPAQHPTIAPKESVKVFFTADGAVGRPAVCTFNGKPC